MFLTSRKRESDEEGVGTYLTIDAMLNEYGRICGKWALVGFEGKLDLADRIWPFILTSDGGVDFDRSPELLNQPERRCDIGPSIFVKRKLP
jgi:hypothetical protein